MGGKPDVYTIQQPTPPQAPSQAETLADYVANYPKLVELQKTYEPQLAALQKSINEQLYPNVAGLSETLANQAQTGMTQEVPSWYQQNIRDSLKAQFGRQLVYDPQAQEQYGLATNQALEDWKRYYQNMGLSVSNKQPLAMGTSNITSSYTPQTAMNFANNNYQTYGNMYGSMYGANANYQAKMNTYNPWSFGWSGQKGLNLGYGG